MKYKLFRALINTYYFGNRSYYIYVLAEDSDEALEYMDKAEEKYKSYSPIEKPRISKKEIKMGKIELLIQAKRYEEALTNLNNYENTYGGLFFTHLITISCLFIQNSYLCIFRLSLRLSII